MALFQQSVIKKYLDALDKAMVKISFIKFQKHFGDTIIQNNIRELNEEQYQEGFLTDLFVNIFGYTMHPRQDFNLLTEQKNTKDSRKSDGAIIFNNSVAAVIELKGTDTTDLSKAENQAFVYKNNHKDCHYIITSNFEKLRFYIDDAIDFEEFNLFNLSEERFQLLYLCLAKDSLINNTPQKLKEASISQEENITRKLYSDYSAFKRILFNNIVDLNPNFDKLTLFRKTQKLLDRLLFIFFAEDRQLLPPNSIHDIIKKWEQLKELDNYVSLYSRFIKFFGYLNTGHKEKQYDIFAYNGGLFIPDEILDNFTIDDSILSEHTIKISNYDFNTDVDVNILGHIFEHSLNEIEEIQAELEGNALEKTISKRKKEGVFYTPKYITKYIVENTVGLLCLNKKQELEINEDETIIASSKIKKKELLEKIDTYRKWLLTLTICDPACGSGAFLNQALDFLISEHRMLDELITKITNASFILPEIENSILENNIFGVDINEEAVEIARLSLWLKTAQKGRKLANLSNNIKCGNSLIDDPAIAGEKAFNWFIEFPQVFPHYNKPKAEPVKDEPEPSDRDFLDEVQEPAFSYKPLSKGFVKHGFDIVISNPPYVRADTDNSEFIKQRKGIEQSGNYKTLYEKWDLMVPFYEKSIKLLKENGLHSFIVSYAICTSKYAYKLQKWILETKNIISIDYFDAIEVFKGVGVIPIISIIENANPSFKVNKFIHKNDFENVTSAQVIYNLSEEDKEIKVFKKDYIKSNIKIATIPLGDICYISKGMVINSDEINDKGAFSKDDLISYIKDEIHNKPFVEGKDLDFYCFKHIKYLEWDTLRIPTQLSRPTFRQLYDGEKILRGRVTPATYDNTGIVCNDGVMVFKRFIDLKGIDVKSIIASITKNNKLTRFELETQSEKFLLKYLLAIINSKYAFQTLNNSRRHRLVNYFYPDDFRNLEIPNIDIEEQQQLANLADNMLILHKEFQQASAKFQRTIQRKFNIIDLPKKLQEWYLLTYNNFIKELEKKKIKLTLAEEAEWEDYFVNESKKVSDLKSIIETTDKQIDLMVCRLYGLEDDEIRIIEGK